MLLDETLRIMTNEGTCEMENTAQRDSSRLPTKIDSNAESTVVIMSIKGYVLEPVSIASSFASLRMIWLLGR